MIAKVAADHDDHDWHRTSHSVHRTSNIIHRSNDERYANADRSPGNEGCAAAEQQPKQSIAQRKIKGVSF